MVDPTNAAAILVAVITGGATVWTQRGSARARKQTAIDTARAQNLAELNALRDTALEEAKELRDELREMRDEMDALRKEIRSLRNEASENSLLLNIASSYIKVLRPLVPQSADAPPLPDILKINDIGVI